MNKVDIADLDCIYLSYDEPQREEFWIKIRNMVPWARRVDGVLGSDAAHKAAAQASSTDRFILIDGDPEHEPIFGACWVQRHVTCDIVVHVVDPRHLFVRDDINVFIEARKDASDAFSRDTVCTGQDFILGTAKQLVSEVGRVDEGVVFSPEIVDNSSRSGKGLLDDW